MVYLVSIDETGAWKSDEEAAAVASATAPSSSDDGAGAPASAISADSAGSLTAEGAAANEAAAQEAAEVEGSEGTQQGMHPGWVKGKPASFNYQVDHSSGRRSSYPPRTRPLLHHLQPILT